MLVLVGHHPVTRYRHLRTEGLCEDGTVGQIVYGSAPCEYSLAASIGELTRVSRPVASRKFFVT